MRATYSVRLSQPFVVDESSLRKIDDLLRANFDKVTLEVVCSDNIEREFETVDALLRFENPPTKRIQKITFRARSPEADARARTAFDAGRLEGVWIDVEATEEVVSKLGSHIGDIVAGTKPWYSGIIKVNFLYALFIALIIVFFLTLAAILLDWWEPPKKAPSETDADRTASTKLSATVLGSMILAFVGAIVLNVLRNVIFPFGTFLIGQGASHHNTLEKFRWGVVVAFFVSATVSLLIGVW